MLLSLHRTSGDGSPSAPVSDLNTRKVQLELTHEVIRDLLQIAQQLSCDHELAASYAIRYAAKMVKEGHDIRTRI